MSTMHPVLQTRAGVLRCRFDSPRHKSSHYINALLIVAIICLCGSVARAQSYPAPWPDQGSADTTFGWIPYTYFGTPVQDQPTSTDNSTGGTTPTQSADIINSGLPSTYIGYDIVRQVIFFRVRLSGSPLTQTPDGGTNDDPFNNVTWSAVIDSDGDGYKEFIVRLNGDTGGPTNNIDDIEVYYENNRSQSLTTAAIRTFATDSAVFPDADTRPGVFNFLKSRAIDPTLSGGGWFLDWQVPLSSLSAAGQAVTPTTPISIGFGTSNSNTDPFQKDVAFNGDFVASADAPFAFGDTYIPSTGITQNPTVRQISVTGCAPSIVSATVQDTLTVAGGTVVTSIASVQFYYQPDSDGDKIPDAGSTPILIGTSTTPATGDPTLWQVTWNNATVRNGTYDIFAIATDQQGNVTTSTSLVYSHNCGVSIGISGRVYSDANVNSQFDPTETGIGVPGLFAKLIGANGGNALQAVAVDAATGLYQFSGVFAGTYTVIIDNNNLLTDITPFLPPGYIGTEAPDQTRSNIVVGNASITGQNFGLFAGSRLSGTVFSDTGSGGIANNGLQDGAETPLAGVVVRATDNAGSTLYTTATTDAAGNYTMFLPSTATSVKVTEINLANYLSTGGRAGNTGGIYDRATDTVSFTAFAGTSYTGVNFADVPVNTFTNDGTRTALANSFVYYPHVFTAGSGGQVSFSTSNVVPPSTPGFNITLFRDTNCSGTLEAGEPEIVAPLAVVAAEQVCILVREEVPQAAALGTQDVITVTAAFSYSNVSPSLSTTHTRTDITTSAGSGLELVKQVDKATAKSGDVITYTITYRNISKDNLSAFVVNDITPDFTVYVAASAGPLPTGLTAVNITAPGVGVAGNVTWQFTGTLAPNASGTLTLQVRVE